MLQYTQLYMKHAIATVLRLLILAIGIAVLAAIIKFPQTEGRAAHLDLISIYSDPFIIFGYIASIPFFVGLYQAFKLLGHLDKNKIFSKASVRAVKNIKYCAFITIGFVVIAEAWIILSNNGDDIAGGIAGGIFLTIISAIVIGASIVLEKYLGKKSK